jgi:hypothetical protein
VSRCEVKIILASKPANGGPTLWTIRSRYWRAIHAEFLTHRVMSRNSGSSRAIPGAKMLDMVRNDTAGPDHWGANQKGMQAGEECNELVIIKPELWHAAKSFFESQGMSPAEAMAHSEPPVAMKREVAWKFSAYLAAMMSESFFDAGYHKQVSNRITEPYQWMNVVKTSTWWDNFFKLRRHKDAQPEFKDLADAIWNAMQEHVEKGLVQVLRRGDWHLPYILPEESLLPLETKLELSTARCAHTSYQTVDGQQMTLDKAHDVFASLLGGDPIHASPAEHQAQLGGEFSYTSEFVSNLAAPWLQHRKFIEYGMKPWESGVRN